MRHSNRGASTKLTITTSKELSVLIDTFQLLPGRCGQVVALYKYFDLGVPEIAQQLGITERTVQRHLARAIWFAVQNPDGTFRRVPHDFRETLYDDSVAQQVDPRKIVEAARPQIIVASEALASKLKRNVEAVHKLSPRQFEKLICELLEDMGWSVFLTPQTHDGGSDILARRNTGLSEILCLVQAKKYSQRRPVGVELVRTMYGTLCDSDATSALLITTSSFTSKARELQRRHRYRLDLKDYADLASWIRHYPRKN